MEAQAVSKNKWRMAQHSETMFYIHGEFQMSHEINIFKETGSGQVTQWPEPNPEESLLAMASQECTRGGSPCLPGMPGGEG